jgi:hypothetical protein
VVADEAVGLHVLTTLAGRLESADEGRRDAGLRLLAALAELLEASEES